MTTTATQAPGSTAAVLAGLRETASEITRAEITKLHLTLDWARLNEADPGDRDVANHGFFGDQPIPVAGEGAPLVAEFAAMEFAAALGMSTHAGTTYLGRVLELGHRLPRLMGMVEAGRVPVWRAFRIADQTISLPAAGAAHVDHHLAPVAHSCSWAQLDRLVEEAMVRFDPDAAEAKRRAAGESRHVDVQLDQVSFDGTVHIDADVDLADALDLDDAIRADAQQQAALGSTDPLGVRRAKALGNLARRQPTLDLNTDDDEDATGSTGPTGRSVVLFVHLTEDALKGSQSVARCGNTRSPISVEQIREWCGNPNTQVVVKPVIDLVDHIHVEAYEVPDRLAEQAALVDVHCVFPYCTQPARRCDHDHITPYDQGGPTCTDNIAPLCRRHHRAKTHSAWDYTVVDRGTYLWTSPHGIRVIRDHRGTHPT